jgi:hypothetical protein
MTATTFIGRLAVRWRPLDASLRDSARFDRLSRALAGGPLEAAIDAEGYRGEVVCVRAVEVPPLRISADVTDDELVGKLAAAIAAAVGTAASDASEHADRVRYRSRAHAALDVATCLARGDHRREWAWRQLGLWPDSGDLAAVGDRLAAALAEAPGMVSGLLSAAAGDGVLGSLAGLLGPGRLDALARAAWTARGCPLAGWNDLLGPAAAPDDADFAQVTAILSGGALGRELLSGTPLPPQSVAAASALALLDGEPSLALRAATQVMPLVTAAALLSLGRSGRADAVPNDAVESGVAGSLAPGRDDAQAGSPSPAAETEPTPRTAPRITSAPSPARPSADSTATESAAGVATEFGGLPYLLHLVGRGGLPERVANGELAGAGLVSLLYGIGIRVLGRLLGPGQPPDPEDAALACLCGRAPVGGWRSDIGAGEQSPRLGEAADAEAERLIAALRAALEPSGLAAAPEQELLTAVCRRAGRIVADPGWIDVHLDLAEVSTDVRRCGLDLDLGYLPWLGCVVRFVYG